MEDLKPDASGPPARTSTRFLVLAWILLVLGGLIIIFATIFSGRLSWARSLPFFVLLFLGITGLLARRLWPRGRLARALPEAIQGQSLERRLSGREVLQAFLIVAALLAAAWIAIQGKLL